MDNYKLGTLHKKDPGSPTPRELDRQPDESLEDFGQRLIEGLPPLATWAVVTDERDITTVTPVSSREEAEKHIDACKGSDRQTESRIGGRLPWKNYQTVYLELGSISVVASYQVGSPPNESQ